MTWENTGGRQTNYGVLPSGSNFGAEKQGAGSIKEIVREVSYDDLPAVDADNEMLANIPANVVIVGATFIVDVGFTGGTSYVFGCSQADGGGVVDADGLIASTAIAAIAGKADYVVGGGALIDADAQAEALSITIGATGTFTAGSGRLTVSYVV